MNALRGHFTITLADGMELPCLCNLYTLQEWGEATGLDLGDLQESLQKQALKQLPLLLWHGIVAAHELDEIPLPIAQRKFQIVFGSSDWTPAVENVGKALNFLEDDGKKKVAKRKAD